MARISKSGLDYFPLDVNFLQDRKVRRISSRHHAAGIAALTSLFCLIYKEKGYYVPWNQDTLFDVAQEACCEEAEMQAIIDDCLAVGLFDPHIYKVYSVLTSQVIQEQYHKIITDSRRKYKLPLEHFWLITDGETEQQKDEYGKENSIAKSENENRNGNRAGTGNGTVSDAAVNDVYATKTGINAAKSPEIATTIPQTKEETDTKGKQETEKERDRGTETKAERDRDREKEIEKEREGETGHPAPAAYGRYNNVILTDTELSGLKTELPDKWEYYIDRLSCHIASTGKQYHSHAATIYKWAQEDAAKGKAAPKQGIPDYSCKEGESL